MDNLYIKNNFILFIIRKILLISYDLSRKSLKEYKFGKLFHDKIKMLVIVSKLVPTDI